MALRAGITQKHVSFLETGRSQPGSRSLRKLTRAMALKGWEHRVLLATLSGGVTEDCSPVHDRLFISEILQRMTAWPAYAFEPDGSLVTTNGPMERLIGWASPDEDLWELTASSGGPNIYNLVFHPSGLCRWLVNPEVVLSETLRRLRVEAADRPELSKTVEGIEAFPSVTELKTESLLPPSMLTEKYRIMGHTITIVSLLSHLASPGEVSLDQLRFEIFVPVDDATEDFFRNF